MCEGKIFSNADKERMEGYFEILERAKDQIVKSKVNLFSNVISLLKS